MNDKQESNSNDSGNFMKHTLSITNQQQADSHSDIKKNIYISMQFTDNYKCPSIVDKLLILLFPPSFQIRIVLHLIYWNEIQIAISTSNSFCFPELCQNSQIKLKNYNFEELLKKERQSQKWDELNEDDPHKN